MPSDRRAAAQHDTLELVLQSKTNENCGAACLKNVLPRQTQFVDGKSRRFAPDERNAVMKAERDAQTS